MNRKLTDKLKEIREPPAHSVLSYINLPFQISPVSPLLQPTISSIRKIILLLQQSFAPYSGKGQYRLDGLKTQEAKLLSPYIRNLENSINTTG